MKSKTKITLALVIMSVLLAWFGWNKIEDSQANLVQQKVAAFLSDGLQGMIINAPRTLVNSDQTGQSYYVPDTLTKEPITSYAVYTRLLYDVNSDLDSPMVKVTDVSLRSDFETIIEATATVKFTYFLGFTKTIVVKSSISEPHFKHATGMELTNGKSYLN